MGLFDSINNRIKGYKQSLTGETDIVCPKCKQSHLYRVDGIYGNDLFCPKCNYNFIRNGGDGPVAPQSGMLMN